MQSTNPADGGLQGKKNFALRQARRHNEFESLVVSPLIRQQPHLSPAERDLELRPLGYYLSLKQCYDSRRRERRGVTNTSDKGTKGSSTTTSSTKQRQVTEKFHESHRYYAFGLSKLITVELIHFISFYSRHMSVTLGLSLTKSLMSVVMNDLGSFTEKDGGGTIAVLVDNSEPQFSGKAFRDDPCRFGYFPYVPLPNLTPLQDHHLLVEAIVKTHQLAMKALLAHQPDGAFALYKYLFLSKQAPKLLLWRQTAGSSVNIPPEFEGLSSQTKKYFNRSLFLVVVALGYGRILNLLLDAWREDLRLEQRKSEEFGWKSTGSNFGFGRELLNAALRGKFVVDFQEPMSRGHHDCKTVKVLLQSKHSWMFDSEDIAAAFRTSVLPVYGGNAADRRIGCMSCAKALLGYPCHPVDCDKNFLQVLLQNAAPFSVDQEMVELVWNRGGGFEFDHDESLSTSQKENIARLYEWSITQPRILAFFLLKFRAVNFNPFCRFVSRSDNGFGGRDISLFIAQFISTVFTQSHNDYSSGLATGEGANRCEADLLFCVETILDKGGRIPDQLGKKDKEKFAEQENGTYLLDPLVLLADGFVHRSAHMVRLLLKASADYHRKKCTENTPQTQRLMDQVARVAMRYKRVENLRIILQEWCEGQTGLSLGVSLQEELITSACRTLNAACLPIVLKFYHPPLNDENTLAELNLFYFNRVSECLSNGDNAVEDLTDRESLGNLQQLLFTPAFFVDYNNSSSDYSEYARRNAAYGGGDGEEEESCCVEVKACNECVNFLLESRERTLEERGGVYNSGSSCSPAEEVEADEKPPAAAAVAGASDSNKGEKQELERDPLYLDGLPWDTTLALFGEVGTIEKLFEASCMASTCLGGGKSSDDRSGAVVPLFHFSESFSTALYFAILSHQLDTISCLLRLFKPLVLGLANGTSQAQPQLASSERVASTFKYGIQLAIGLGDVEAAKLLLRYLKENENEDDEEPNSPMSSALAGRGGNFSTLREELLNYPAEEGYVTPLDYAIIYSHSHNFPMKENGAYSMVDLLIEYGAQLLPSSPATKLLLENIVQNSHVDRLRWIFEKNPGLHLHLQEVNCCFDGRSKSFFPYLFITLPGKCAASDPEMLRLLVLDPQYRPQYRVLPSPFVTDSYGFSPLHYASARPECTEVLREMIQISVGGGEPHELPQTSSSFISQSTNSLGLTPLHVAARARNISGLRILLEPTIPEGGGGNTNSRSSSSSSTPVVSGFTLLGLLELARGDNDFQRELLNYATTSLRINLDDQLPTKTKKRGKPISSSQHSEYNSYMMTEFSSRSVNDALTFVCGNDPEEGEQSSFVLSHSCTKKTLQDSFQLVSDFSKVKVTELTRQKPTTGGEKKNKKRQSLGDEPSLCQTVILPKWSTRCTTSKGKKKKK